MASELSESQRRRPLADADLTEGAWPGEDPECLMCQLAPEEREEIHRRVLEGEDMYLIDDQGFWYPVLLRYITVGAGDDGLPKMLGLVKTDVRRTGHDHSHTARLKAH